MKTSMILAALAATAAFSAAAQAQGMGDPYGDATVARAEEQTKAAERFATFDTNKDGTISADEVEAAPRGPGSGGLRRADGDGDGKITKDEYVAAQLQRFDSQDADKDGQLTKAERDAARAARGQGGGGWGGPPPGQ